MRYGRSFVRFTVFAVLLFAAATAASPFGSIEYLGSETTFTYSTGDTTEIYGSLELLTIMASGTGFITFSTGSSGTFANRTLANGASVLSYQLHNTDAGRTVVKDLSADPTTEETLTFVIPENAVTCNVPFVLTIPAGQTIIPGEYLDEITVTVYTGTIENPEEESQGTLTLRGPVQSSLRIHLAEPGGEFPLFGSPSTARTLDFGVFETGESLQADLLVEANCAFTVSLESENGGVMLDPAIDDGSAVPYSLTFAGSRLELESGGPVPAGSSPGSRYPIVVTVDEFGMASPGEYRDVVTITVSAN